MGRRNSPMGMQGQACASAPVASPFKARLVPACQMGRHAGPTYTVKYCRLEILIP